MLEARLGAGYIRAEAMQEALPDFYQQAVVRHDVDVIAPPEIDITAGRDEVAVSFEAVVEVRPEVTADGYEALAVEIPSPLPTDEEISTRIDALRAQFSELETVSRPAIDTDHVTIDVVGSQNGVEVEGLTCPDYPRGGVRPPSFRRSTEPARRQAGDILEFNARHPDESIEDLLRFRILVKEVQARILPDSTTTWSLRPASSTRSPSSATTSPRRLTELKTAQVRMLFRERISEAVAHLVVADLPEALIVTETDRPPRRPAAGAGESERHAGGVSRRNRADTDELRDQLREAAEQSVRLDLALRAVADAEQLEWTTPTCRRRPTAPPSAWNSTLPKSVTASAAAAAGPRCAPSAARPWPSTG